MQVPCSFLFEPQHVKQSFRNMHPTKTQISLHIRAVWSETSLSACSITKTCLYNIDPLKPHFYIVKLGFTGVYIIFLISVQNIDCGYSLEPPRRGGSNVYPQSMFWAEMWKILKLFLSEKFRFLEVKVSIYLNRRVFVMKLRFPGYPKSTQWRYWSDCAVGS